ncbi:MAG: amidohydrolase family protein, partial [Bacteroidota bacterium]|nr:amidohydrolase family protein [Bacteroidota bacterium]
TPFKTKKMYRKVVIPFLVISFMVSSCTSSKMELYQTMDKIDAHVHIRTTNPAFMEYAASEGFKLLTINTRSNSQEYIDAQKAYAMEMKSLYPQGISWLATFSMENFEEEGWAEEVIRKLQADLDQGAVGFKIWKDIGMTFQDSLGQFVFLDDLLFEPVLEFMEASGYPLLTHIGEPKNCWLPIDSMTVNGDKSYFKSHPEYHMYLHPDYPSHERLMQSRDHVLATYTDLKMIGAHLGSLEWDVDVLAARLDLYPNFAVDLAARVCHFQVQESEKVRDFIIKYQDRILYATDLGVTDENVDDRIQWLGNEWRSDWSYFASDSLMSSRNVDGEFRGLDLDEEVLRKIFRTNALQWYPEAFE